MEHRLIVAGIGPGSREYILPKALHAIESAKYLAGGRRALADFASAGQETYPVTGKLSELADWIRSALACSDVTVMVSGDPGFYSLLPWLKSSLSIRRSKSSRGFLPCRRPSAASASRGRARIGCLFTGGRRKRKTGLPAGEETGVSHRSRT